MKRTLRTGHTANAPRRAVMPFVQFCKAELKLELTDAWRVLLLVAIDGVEPEQLDPADRELARTLFGNVDTIPPIARAVLVWRLGRGSGKSTIAAALAVWSAWTTSLDDVGPGMLAAAVVVAPARRTAGIWLRVARELVRGSALERYVEKKSDNTEGFTLRRPDGRAVALMAVAASRGGASLRGFDIIALVLDESEFFASNEDVASADGYAISDRDMFAAAMPRLRGKAVFISTPWPTENLTAELFDRNHGKPTDALAAEGSSLFMRPSDRLKQIVEQELARDNDTAMREFFVKAGVVGSSRLFDGPSVDACADETRPLVVIAPPGSVVAGGGDLGLERDSSVACAVGRLDDRFTLLEFDEVRPAKGQPLTPGYVIRERFAPLLQRHRAPSIMMDAHYRQSAVEHLSAVSLGMDDAPAGSQGKYDSYMFLRSLLRECRITYPASPRLKAQLRAVTTTPLAGGLVRISSPRRAGSGHGDIVSALVCACWNLQNGGFGDYAGMMRDLPGGF